MNRMKKYTRKLKRKLDKRKMNWEDIDNMELKQIRNRAREITDMRIKKNIMSLINPKELQEFCIYAYEKLIEKARKNGDIYHFDGKVERGSARKTDKNNKKIKPLNVLNVYSEGAGICID